MLGSGHALFQSRDFENLEKILLRHNGIGMLAWKKK